MYIYIYIYNIYIYSILNLENIAKNIFVTYLAFFFKDKNTKKRANFLIFSSRELRARYADRTLVYQMYIT